MRLRGVKWIEARRRDERLNKRMRVKRTPRRPEKKRNDTFLRIANALVTGCHSFHGAICLAKKPQKKPERMRRERGIKRRCRHREQNQSSCDRDLLQRLADSAVIYSASASAWDQREDVGRGRERAVRHALIPCLTIDCVLLLSSRRLVFVMSSLQKWETRKRSLLSRRSIRSTFLPRTSSSPSSSCQSPQDWITHPWRDDDHHHVHMTCNQKLVSPCSRFLQGIGIEGKLNQKLRFF